ncbi:unnamed protein product [Paramecium octaurelia]|uniref:Glycylpeptide N-tetradecanoyltransferase n=1 Tax=Paramecium octaurelia TaxID=43137 RepID=A0A8S1SHM1_PAROT|nr:unnamed protein product [Paramecium octaurelia]
MSPQKLMMNRLTPVLIKQITRRVRKKYVVSYIHCRYSSLKSKFLRLHITIKVIEIGFSFLSGRQTTSREQKYYKLPEEPKTPGLRPIKNNDVAQVTKLLNEYLKQINSIYLKILSYILKILKKKSTFYSYLEKM